MLLLVLDTSMYQTRPPQCPVQVSTHSAIHTCHGTWPWVACGVISWYHLVNPCLWNGFMLHVLRFSSMTENCGFSFHYWLHIHLYSSAWASASITKWGEGSPGRTSTAAVGAIHIAQMTAREAKLYNLLSPILLNLYVILDHQTVEPQINIGLITMVYVQYTTLGIRPQVFLNVSFVIQKAL
jgi:hypothetical protein